MALAAAGAARGGELPRGRSGDLRCRARRRAKACERRRHRADRIGLRPTASSRAGVPGRGRRRRGPDRSRRGGRPSQVPGVPGKLRLRDGSRRVGQLGPCSPRPHGCCGPTSRAAPMRHPTLPECRVRALQPVLLRPWRPHGPQAALWRGMSSWRQRRNRAAPRGAGRSVRAWIRGRSRWRDALRHGNGAIKKYPAQSTTRTASRAISRRGGRDEQASFGGGGRTRGKA